MNDVADHLASHRPGAGSAPEHAGRMAMVAIG